MPPLPATAIQDNRWDALDPKLQQWLDLARRREALKSSWGLLVKPEAEREEWQPLLNRRIAQGRSFTRFFNPSWHSDSRRLLQFTLSGKLPDLDGQIALLKSLIESNQLRRRIDNESFAWIDQIGPAWQGLDGNWTALDQYVRAAVAVRKLLNTGRVGLPAALALVPSSDRSALGREHDAAKNATAKLDAAWRNWLEAIASDDQQWLGMDWDSAELPAVAERIAPLPQQLEKLADWVDFHQLSPRTVERAARLVLRVPAHSLQPARARTRPGGIWAPLLSPVPVPEEAHCGPAKPPRVPRAGSEVAHRAASAIWISGWIRRPHPTSTGLTRLAANRAAISTGASPIEARPASSRIPQESPPHAAAKSPRRGRRSRAVDQTLLHDEQARHVGLAVPRARRARV